MRVGVDVQGEDAIVAALERHGSAYLDRVFTEVEQTSAKASIRPFHAALTVLYASKEAVLKVLQTPGGVPLTDVEILLPDAGPPTVNLAGVAHQLAEDQRLGPVMLSTSHDGSVAVAFAIAALVAAGSGDAPDSGADRFTEECDGQQGGGRDRPRDPG